MCRGRDEREGDVVLLNLRTECKIWVLLRLEMCVETLHRTWPWTYSLTHVIVLWSREGFGTESSGHYVHPDPHLD